MKKSLIALLFLIIGSCTVKPDDLPLVDLAEIAKFAKTISDAELVFVNNGKLIPFEIALDGTYSDGQGVTYQISKIINETTVSAISVDFGEQTHELLDEVFGVPFQGIAFKKATPEEIAAFKNTIPEGLISEQNGYWEAFLIDDEGKYTTSGVTYYEIVRFINLNTVLVVKDTGSVETHTLTSTNFSRVTAVDGITEIAFKRVTSDEIDLLRGKLVDFIYRHNNAWDSFEIAPAGTTYTVNDITYDIGKIIDGNTDSPIVLVAKRSGGIEKHKLIGGTTYGLINEASNDITEIAFLGSSDSVIQNYLATLSEYIFAKNSAWVSLPKTLKSYEDADGKIYSIGRVNPETSTILVANSSGTLETHGIRESVFGEISLSVISRQIAFKRATKEEIEDLRNTTLPGFIFGKDGAWVPLTITTTGTPPISTYTDADDVTYEIGRIGTDTTLNTIVVEVAKSGTGVTKIIEKHGILETSFGRLTSTGGVIEKAFKRATEVEIEYLRNTILAGFIFEKDGAWVPLTITTTGTPPISTYTDADDVTYEIGRIDTTLNTIVVEVAKSGTGVTKIIEKHGILGTSFGHLPAAGGIIEKAFKRATEVEIEYLRNTILPGFIFEKDGAWVPLTITTTGTPPISTYTDADDVTYEIGRIGTDTTLNTIVVEVAKSGTGVTKIIEKHGILGIYFGHLNPGGGITEKAFKRATEVEIEYLRNTTLAGFIFEKNEAWIPLTITTTGTPPISTYTDADDVTYEIGRIDTALNTVDVAKSGTGVTKIIEKHRILGTTFGRLNSGGGITEKAFKRATSDEITILEGKLAGFNFFHKNGDYRNLTITSTGTPPISTYTDADDITYEIGKINTTSSSYTIEISKLVASTHTRETHGLIDNQYGKLNTTGTDLETVIASKGTTLDPGFDTGIVKNLSFALSPSGDRLVMAYLSGKKPSAIQFSLSSSVVGKWETMNIIGTEEALDVSLAFDPSSTAYVAFTDESEGNKLSVKTWNGTSWVTLGRPLISTDKANHISLAFWGAVPYVAYSDNDAMSEKASVHAYTTDWNSAGNLKFSDGKATDISMAIDNSTGNRYVAYTDGSDSDKITVMALYNPPASWTLVGPKGFSTGGATNISIVIHNSIPYVAYQDTVDNLTYVKKFENSSWTLVGSTINALSPSLAISTSGTLYVAYRENIGGKVTLKKLVGTAWESIAENFSKGTSSQISLIIDSTSTPYVAYYDETLQKAVVKRF